MMRVAGPGDRAAVEAFLVRHVEAAMFPLANLRDHGLGDGDFASEHDHATRYWICVGGGILALTRGGMLLPVLPDGANAGEVTKALAGLDIAGAVGPADQVRALLAGVGLAGRPTRKDADEPGMVLDLGKLRVPQSDGTTLQPVGAALRDEVVGWRADSHRELLGTPEDQLLALAGAEIDRGIARDSLRVLMMAGQPVAMTAFNAILPEIVQIGGVFVPRALRSRGYARLAVALHLAEARARGVGRAVLFAASAAAVRAYRGIGFQPAAPVGLVLFDRPQRVQG